MYFEDADLCYRLRLCGWEAHFTPAATVVQVGGASTIQRGADMAVQLLASTLQFYQRHSSGIRVAKLLMVVKSLMLSKWIGGTFRFCFTRYATKRSKIADDMAASKRILLEH